ncbi:putative iron-regulated protein [Lewinella aquimaris]|uniref:Putative iron-regulated protein n=1 Tax=Neolewinella aquimaris TaxID=1835722 RepID=A0A840E238_9BACT|nr:ChaN family lipoprotein [Neolewinella aquimaris]MBB4077812.1 putative iron-regulated protein [Neolewinella aquimaris]
MTARFTLFLLLASLGIFAQSNPQAFALYNKKGKEVSFNKMMKDLGDADVILFGEYHDNPIGHWMELEIADRLGEYDLGLEMFETDEQDALDRFMTEEITVEELDSIIGGVWPNFKTDYLPLLLKARRDSAAVIATNTPRRYARMVFQRGLVVLQSLPDEDQAFLPPLPPPYDPELPSYKAMVVSSQGMGHNGENYPKAQAIKDATMAWFIAKNIRAGRTMLHLNGSYHSDDFEGIGWYLRQYKPQLRVVTITTLEQPSVDELLPEFVGKANYTLLVPDNMTKTY